MRLVGGAVCEVGSQAFDRLDKRTTAIENEMKSRRAVPMSSRGLNLTRVIQCECQHDLSRKRIIIPSVDV